MMYNHFTFKETNKTMDKNIIRYAIKDVFKKTKIICPNCGTIQDYKNIKCSKCNQSLDGLKDNTLKIKNCIRVGIGIVFLSLVAVVVAIIINNSMRKGSTTDNTVYVENKTSSLVDKTSEPMTTKKSDNETSPEVTKSTTEASTTEQVTTETPIVPETKAAEMPTTELQKPTEEPTTPVPIKQNVTELKDETVNGVVNKLCTAIREGRNSDDKSLKVLYESINNEKSNIGNITNVSFNERYSFNPSEFGQYGDVDLNTTRVIGDFRIQGDKAVMNFSVGISTVKKDNYWVVDSVYSCMRYCEEGNELENVRAIIQEKINAGGYYGLYSSIEYNSDIIDLSNPSKIQSSDEIKTKALIKEVSDAYGNEIVLKCPEHKKCNRIVIDISEGRVLIKHDAYGDNAP